MIKLAGECSTNWTPYNFGEWLCFKRGPCAIEWFTWFLFSIILNTFKVSLIRKGDIINQYLLKIYSANKFYYFHAMNIHNFVTFDPISVSLEFVSRVWPSFKPPSVMTVPCYWQSGIAYIYCLMETIWNDFIRKYECYPSPHPPPPPPPTHPQS